MHLLDPLPCSPQDKKNVTTGQQASGYTACMECRGGDACGPEALAWKLPNMIFSGRSAGSMQLRHETSGKAQLKAFELRQLELVKPVEHWTQMEQTLRLLR